MVNAPGQSETADTASITEVTPDYAKQGNVFCGVAANEAHFPTSTWLDYTIESCMDQCSHDLSCFGFAFTIKGAEPESVPWCVRYTVFEFCSMDSAIEWDLYTKNKEVINHDVDAFKVLRASDGHYTDAPTKTPTAHPTDSPTSHPTHAPTDKPTGCPTVSPTQGPTRTPTAFPTGVPTDPPTVYPTPLPTNMPTGSYGERLKDGTEVVAAGSKEIVSALDDDLTEVAFKDYSESLITALSDYDYIEDIDDDYLRADSEMRAAEGLMDFFEHGGVDHEGSISKAEMKAVKHAEVAAAAGADDDMVWTAMKGGVNPIQAAQALADAKTHAPTVSPTAVPSSQPTLEPTANTKSPTLALTELILTMPMPPLDSSGTSSGTSHIASYGTSYGTAYDTSYASSGAPDSYGIDAIEEPLPPICSADLSVCNVVQNARATCCNGFVEMQPEGSCRDCVLLFYYGDSGAAEYQDAATVAAVYQTKANDEANAEAQEQKANRSASAQKRIGAVVSGSAVLLILVLIVVTRRRSKSRIRWYARSSHSLPFEASAAIPKEWSFEASDVGTPASESAAKKAHITSI
jgi:hypothetical protein